MSKNTHLLSPGGVKGVQIFPQLSKMGKILILCPFGPFQISNIYKTHLKRRLIYISSKLIKKTAGDIPIYGHPGGQNTNFWPKNTPNVGINANNFKIWTILQWKLTITDILDEVW